MSNPFHFLHISPYIPPLIIEDGCIELTPGVSSGPFGDVRGFSWETDGLGSISGSWTGAEIQALLTVEGNTENSTLVLALTGNTLDTLAGRTLNVQGLGEFAFDDGSGSYSAMGGSTSYQWPVTFDFFEQTDPYVICVETAEATEAGTEALTEAGTEALTEAGTEALTEAGTEALTEAGTEALTEAGTEQATEAGTEQATEAGTEQATEAATEAPTEAATEAPTEAATEALTEAGTEALTEAGTEALTEALTEQPTEAATEALTEAGTEASGPPVIESFSTAIENGDTNSITIDKPTGTQEGDLLIAHIGWGSVGTVTFVTPPGWTQVNGGQFTWATTVVYYKIAGPSEPSTYTFTKTDSGNTESTGAILRISNYSEAEPISGSSLRGQGSNTTSHSTNPVIANNDDSLWIGFVSGGWAPFSYTPPAGTTEIYDQANDTGGRDNTTTTAAYQLTDAAIVPAKTFVCSVGLNYAAVALVVNGVAGADIRLDLPHRYWRVLVYASTGATGLSLWEVEFLNGGVDQAETGFAIESSHFDALVAANAFDDSTSTLWASDFSGTWPQYIGQDFGEGNEQIIDAVSIQLSNQATNRAPQTFSIQYSDNGTDWVTVDSHLSETGWALNEKRTYELDPTE